MRDLLNRHPGIGIPEVETEFLPYLAANIHRFGDLRSRSSFKDFYRHITRFPYFIYRHDSGGMIGEDEWYENCERFDAAGLFEGLIRAETGITRSCDRLWGDKSPSYLNHLELITSLFPTARIIHIVRDARDYCVSMKRAWNKAPFRAAERWEHGVLAARKFADRVGPRVCLEIRYEDMTEQPETTLREVCSFLGIKFIDDMIRLERPVENIGNTRGRNTIVAGNQGHWKHLMEPREIARIEGLAWHGMNAFGYARTRDIQPAKLSHSERLILQVKDASELIRFEAKKRGFIGAIKFRLGYFVVTRFV